MSSIADPRILSFLLARPLDVLLLPFRAAYWNLRLLALRLRGYRVVVHYVDGVEYLPFARPIWDRLCRRPEFSQVALFLAARPGQRRAVCELVNDPALRIRGIVPAWVCATLVVYDLFLTTHQSSVVPLLRRGPRICTFHGLPAKGGTFVREQWRQLDGAFLHGPLQKRLFEQLGAAEGERARWSREVGYPKSDGLLRGAFDPARIREQLGLAANRGTILYAPSWEEGTSLRVQGRAVIERLLAMGLQVVLKLHPMMYYPPTELRATGGVDWSREFLDLESRSDFRHVRGGDASPLVAACDLLVTDVSSIAFEAILVDRPVIFLDVPQFFEATVGRMYGLSASEAREDLRYNCGRAGGRVARDLEDLDRLVRADLESPGALARERAEVRRELIFHPGGAAEQAAAAVVDLLRGGSRTEH